MWKKLMAVILSLAVPAGASAGPLKEAIEKAGRETRLAQQDTGRSKARLWTGIALLAGGGTLIALGGLELGDDENGPDDGEDLNGSDDGEDSDGWGNKAALGGGIAAAALGAVVLLTGGKSNPVVTARPGSVSIRHTIRF